MIPKYNEFLKKVIEYQISEMPEELSEAAKIIKKDWKKILEGKEPSELKNIENEYDIRFMKYKEKNRCQVRDYEKEDIEYAAKLECALKTWHKNIITSENSSDILPFVYFFPRLYWDDRVVELAARYFESGVIPKISSHLFEILMSKKIDKIQSNNYRDNKLIELYYAGVNEKNLRNIFDFFSSIEQGCGLPTPDSLTFSSRKILSHIDLDKYMDLLNSNQKNPLEIYDLMSSLTPDQRVALLTEKHHQLNNPFSIIFLLRLFLYDVWNNTEIGDDLIEKTSLGYLRLFEIDNDYGMQSIIEFTRYSGNKTIFKIIGVLLGKLNDNQFRKYVKNEKIRDFDGFTDYYFELLKYLEKHADIERFSFYVAESYNKWLNTLNEYGTDKKYSFSLIINSHTQIAYKYLSMLGKEELENIIIKEKEEVKSLSSKRWMSSSSEAITLFFVSFTKLYYSISAIKEKGYRIDDALTIEINELLASKWVKMRYAKYNEEEFLKQIEEIKIL